MRVTITGTRISDHNSSRYEDEPRYLEILSLLMPHGHVNRRYMEFLNLSIFYGKCQYILCLPSSS